MLPYINFFGFEIQTYGIFAAIGFMISAIMAVNLGKRRDITAEKSLTAMLAAAAGVFLGGHLLFTLTNMKEISGLVSDGNFSFSALMPYVSGMVFYGGLLGSMLSIHIYSKADKGVSRADVFDVFAVSAPLFHAFGRVGCFFAGCCYGVESKFGIATYLNNSPTHYGVSRFPVALFEAFSNILIFVLLLVFFKRKKLYGKLILLYLSIYAPVRFALEFFRGDEIRGFIFGLSTSQFISLLIMLFLLIYLLINLLRKSSKVN